VVAATGSDRDDAAAMHKAEVGLVLRKADAVAKDAADAVVESDSIHALVKALFLARVNDENYRKATFFTVQKMIPQMVSSTMATPLLAIPPPSTTMLTMVTDVLIDLPVILALVYERPEAGVLHSPPRAASDPAVGRPVWLFTWLLIGVLQTLGFFWAYIMVFREHGVAFTDLVAAGHHWLNADIPVYLGHAAPQRLQIHLEAKGAVLLCSVIQQTASIFARRRRTAPLMRWGHPGDLVENRYLVLGVAWSLLAVSAMIYMPTLNYYFDVRPASGRMWAYPLLPATVLLLLVEGKKWLYRTKGPDYWLFKYVEH
jgi:magnesium-transporting ATPase (P-type)